MAAWAASVFGAFAFSDSSVLEFWLIGAVAFLIVYPLDFMNLDVRFPFLVIPIERLLECYAVYIFFRFAEKPSPVWTLFWFFVGLAWAGNMLLDMRERYQRTNESRLNELVIILFICFGTYVAYGGTLIPHIKGWLGGGEPIRARIFLESVWKRDQWLILRNRRLPMATWIMASETSRRCS